MQSHVIRYAEELIQIGEPHLHLLGAVGGDEGVVGDHLHAHGPGDAGHMGTDLAQTHHTERLFVELVADVFLAVPLAGPHARMGLGHMPGQREHHRQGMLRGRDGVALRRIHHQDSPLGGRGHIDVVDTDAGTADDLEPGRRGDHVGRHLCARTDHQSVVVADAGLQVLGRHAGALIHLRHLTENVDPGLVNGIGNQNFRHERALNSRAEL